MVECEMSVYKREYVYISELIIRLINVIRKNVI